MENKKWEPKVGERYYFLEVDANLRYTICNRIFDNELADNLNLHRNNCFKSFQDISDFDIEEQIAYIGSLQRFCELESSRENNWHLNNAKKWRKRCNELEASHKKYVLLVRVAVALNIAAFVCNLICSFN